MQGRIYVCTRPYLGLPHGALDAVFALDALDVNVEVKLAHAGQDGLLGVRVGVNAKGWVFLREPARDEVRKKMARLKHQTRSTNSKIKACQ